MSTKKQQAQNTKNKASLAKAQALNIDTALGAIGTASVRINATMSKIGEELVAKNAELQAVDEAIDLKRQEMEALHGADQILLTIDELKAQHAKIVDDLSKEREFIKTSNDEFRQQLETTRRRDDADFTYNLNLKRKADEDAWQEQIRVRGNQERDRREALEKDFATREASLKAREVEFQAALAKAASFDADLATKVKEEVAKVSGAMTRDFNHKDQMTAVTHKSEVMSLTKDLESKDKAILALERELAETKTQLKNAVDAQVALATKTVEGANNTKAQADALALVTNIGSGNGRPARS